MTIEKFTGSFSKEESGATILLNETVRLIKDPAALGVYCYLLTRPNSWEINAKQMMSHFGIGKDKIYKILKCLIGLGLLTRTEIKENGRYAKYHYLLRLKPDVSPCADFQHAEKPETYKTKIIINKDNTTISEFENSPTIATSKKPKTNDMLHELINIYRTVFPDNPQPHKTVISTSLQKTMLALMKRWPELDPHGRALTAETFEKYLTLLKTTAPKFALGEYVTADGNRKKNTLETFARWNTVVKFMENAYS